MQLRRREELGLAQLQVAQDLGHPRDGKRSGCLRVCLPAPGCEARAGRGEERRGGEGEKGQDRGGTGRMREELLLSPGVPGRPRPESSTVMNGRDSLVTLDTNIPQRCRSPPCCSE